MSEINVVAIITGKPGTGDRLEPALAAMVAATHHHPGCLLYSLQRSTVNPDEFVTVEKWADEQDLQAHLATDDVQNLLTGESSSLLAGMPKIITSRTVEAGEESLNHF